MEPCGVRTDDLSDLKNSLPWALKVGHVHGHNGMIICLSGFLIFKQKIVFIMLFIRMSNMNFW